MMKKYFLFHLLLLGICSFAQYPSSIGANIDHTWPICNPGDCTTLNVSYPIQRETTAYQVSSIPHNPPFDTTSGSATNIITDDMWSGVIDLKGITPENFNFCFYGQVYNKVLISSNGVVTFSVNGFVPGGLYNPNGPSNWSFSAPLPSGTTNGPFRGAIHGVYQDTDPRISNSFAHPNINYYTLGSYPNRVFVVNFSQVAQYANPCSSDSTIGAQTSQIVLYEATNVIDVYVARRVPCTSWNSGNGLIGIQNQDGTIASVPPGRNVGAWSATNEAWRFTPNGNTITPSIAWSKNGNPYGSGNPINVCTTSSEQYTATVSYPLCNGGSRDISDSVTVALEPQVQEPNDLTVCTSQSGPVSYDLTSNNSVMLGALNPGNYSVSYYITQTDALNGTNPILNPQAFLSPGNQTVYAGVESLNTGCNFVKSFDLLIGSNPLPPSGDANQNFVSGETLANIELVGTNIKWYGSATGNDFLPNSTLLVDGATYYASQTNSAGCESRTNPSRFAVTVHHVLSNQDFNMNDLKLYPNPVKDVLNLSYSTEISSVEVYNMLGQKVMVKTLNVAQGQIDMSNLNSGNYIVKVTADGLTKTIKVVKQ